MELGGDLPTHDGLRTGGANVLGGHQLRNGDVVVARDMDSDDRWLAEVVHAEGHPADMSYTLRLLGPWEGPRVWLNDDPRWQ